MAGDDGFGFDLRLVDDVSDNAHHAKAALSELTDEVQKLAEAWLGFEAIKKLGEKAIEGVKFAAEVADFKEDTTAAYAAIAGTAEEGDAIFATFDTLARRIHMPAEKAHELASSLMLQGLEDTKRVGEVIEAQSALIRTGQLAGAAKLEKIVEKSIVSGHFAAGKNVKALAGLGIDAALAKELQSGQLTVEQGIDKITQAIVNGKIGKVAKEKYGLTEFFDDVSNSIRRAAQSTDLKAFNDSLGELSGVIDGLTEKDGALQVMFQDLVDGAAVAIDWISKMTTATGNLLRETDAAVPAMKDDWKGLKSVVVDFGDTGISALKKFTTYLYGGTLIAIDTVRAGMEQLGAEAAYAFDRLIHPLDSTEAAARRFNNMRKTVDDINAGLQRDIDGVAKLEDDMITGASGAKKLDREAKEITVDADHAGKAIGFMADKAKALKAIGIEDLVLLPFLGAPGRSLLDDTGGGFANRMGAGLPSTIDASGFSLGSATAAMAQATGRGPTPPPVSSGRSISLTWTGNVLVGQNETADHLRPVVESALADAFERLQLELGG